MSAPTFYRNLAVIAAASAGLTLAYLHFSTSKVTGAPQVCEESHAGCGLTSEAATPSWDIPTNPKELAAYNYAHALRLPDSMPPTQSFDFQAAQAMEKQGGKDVAELYFEHLCSTEFVEKKVKDVKGVEGFRLLRPRRSVDGTPADKSRFALEEPTGVGWFEDEIAFYDEPSLVSQTFVQPLAGLFRYVEFRAMDDSNDVIAIERQESPSEDLFPRGLDSGWRGFPTIRWYVKRHKRPAFESRYAYTWRGIRRERDREFGIAGAEFFVVDLQDNSVVSVLRTFNSTYVPERPEFVRWSAAKDCRPLNELITARTFIARALQPDIHVNDRFLPPELQPTYHEFLKKRIFKVTHAL